MAQTDTWITLVKADLQNAVNDSELEALLNTALANGQSDPTAAVLADVTGDVRGYVRRRNTLGPAGTIPSEVKLAAVDIAAYRIASRVSNSDTAKAWKQAHDDGIKKLEGVAKGEIYVSAPLTPTTDVTSAPLPQTGEPRNHGFGYEQERGL